MKEKSVTIQEEAEILKQIDQQLKGLSPDVRKEAFQILVQRHLGGALSKADIKAAPVAKTAVPKARARKARVAPTIVKDLNLKKEGKAPSLREFYAEKKPKEFAEQNAAFVYYLSKLKEIGSITPNHIYTCYKEVNTRIPGAFYQSLTDTARRQGWIDMSNSEDIRITTVGENFVEHDLPKKVKES